MKKTSLGIVIILNICLIVLLQTTAHNEINIPPINDDGPRNDRPKDKERP